MGVVLAGGVGQWSEARQVLVPLSLLSQGMSGSIAGCLKQLEVGVSNILANCPVFQCIRLIQIYYGR